MNPPCPACASQTRAGQLQNVPCFECDSCRGHFLRGEVLENFLQDRGLPNGYRRLMESALEAPPATRKLTCPVCVGQTYRVVTSGLVAIDVCHLCVGVYLDKGEAGVFLMQTRATTKLWGKTTNAVDTADAANNVADVVATIFNLFH